MRDPGSKATLPADRLPVIRAETLSMAYPVYERPRDVLLELLTGRARHNLFWALRDLSFTVRERQRLGIIGPNGSGKTTLLRIIIGNLAPSSGAIEVNGRISAMLSLATAMNPEDTGLNNIRFNLLLNGCDPSEIGRLTEEIADFAELGPFIYAPVKTYSAGMNARLAFTIATAIEPEILVVDEVLGAGDAYFIGKATRRMINLCERGKALVFVSHSTSAVQMLCDTVLWLDNGSIRRMGPAEHVLKLYEEDYRRREDEAIREQNMLRKQRRSFQVRFGEVEDGEVCRIRLAPGGGGRALGHTHYVRSIRVSGEGLQPIDVSLQLADIRSQGTLACLDLMESEWGRLFSKGGHACRILTAQSSRSGGGHILLKRPSSVSGVWRIAVQAELCSSGPEELDFEFVDYRHGEWRKVGEAERTELEDGWKAIESPIEIPVVDREQHQRVLAKLREDARPDVEIQDIWLLVDGERTRSVQERQPFEIRVRVAANRPTPRADVGIKIVRSDGVYVFWQSSGLDGQNLVELEGEITAAFRFQPNLLSQGEYHLSAYCSNGWDFPANYPYSEVFDRWVDRLTFSVRAELPGLDFGQLNMRVPVAYLAEE